MMSYAPDYCVAFGQEYSKSFLKFILNKDEFLSQDIEIIEHISWTPQKAFAYCRGMIFDRFKEIDDKIRVFVQTSPPDEVPYLLGIYEEHFKRTLFGVSSIFQSDCDIPQIIKNLTELELKRLDRFSLNYIHNRGLIKKTDFSNLRLTPPYYAWVQQVKIRDEFKCKRCGSSKDLVAHHIKPVSEAPEIATDLHNGMTLCEKCHKAYHNRRPVKLCNVQSLYSFINNYLGEKE